ncbi:MAG: putative iron-sulfur cluster assembly scaffold protein for SUF system, SufE2 [Candidatus Carbobacillus altaicus]|uniref:Putative iron-sulfur cluster assembly scaffold protein for SUF system, SufE2 n=1 Tax=Candidatus Carbonibacillus altaicus TaxID=2163959 RepID=A0A2R6Y4Q6_9BACL|nr:MAG: putative iron-sulfur cluster assembly scaffold protein for SUF system, SufE2 [Candidatus Carbobacillus altaicus]
MSLDDLYRQVILDHAQHPRARGVLSGDDVRAIDLKNPTCGDHITLYVRIQDGKVQDIRFTGEGCSISQASASMMADMLKGQNIEAAERVKDIFLKMIQGHDLVESEEETLGDAVALKGVAQFPARIKCATLAWKALEQGITDHSS